ncbi:MAG: ribonuclease H-like domain-containing protein [Lachnospiraceae bacterium]|nr:ribonuclease H-like domain-containing protein [Lachnospiraceae bacterium]
MKEIRKTYPSENTEYELTGFCPRDKVLFVDIETTGLSKERSNLYLIGAGYFKDQNFCTIQWFAEAPREENFILDDFLTFAEDFDGLLHYNGKRFDLPYIDYKAKLYGYDNPLNSLKTFDIYLTMKPYQKLMGFSSLKQRDIERFLGKDSDDPYTGRDLISVYYDYVRDPDEDKLNSLLYHNLEDLKGILFILPIIKYDSLKTLSPGLKDIVKNSYSDYLGNKKNELILTFEHELTFPKPFKSLNKDIFLSMSDRELMIRVPIKEMTLKHFYENYRDYYYLPLEDTCILKSAAHGVSRDRRERAKKENCCMKKNGNFIPIFQMPANEPSFKTDYKSDINYIIYDDSILEKKEVLKDYASALLEYLIK